MKDRYIGYILLAIAVLIVGAYVINRLLARHRANKKIAERNRLNAVGATFLVNQICSAFDQGVRQQVSLIHTVCDQIVEVDIEPCGRVTATVISQVAGEAIHDAFRLLIGKRELNNGRRPILGIRIKKVPRLATAL